MKVNITWFTLENTTKLQKVNTDMWSVIIKFYSKTETQDKHMVNDCRLYCKTKAQDRHMVNDCKLYRKTEIQDRHMVNYKLNSKTETEQTQGQWL